MASLRIHPAPVRGRVPAQPSKSMAHRAVICAALASGVSKVDNIVLSDDLTATIDAVKALGAEVVIEGSIKYPGRKCLTIQSDGRVLLKRDLIDCIESGSTARFIMPLTRLVPDTVTLTGRGRLVERPFGIYEELFIQKGVLYKASDGKMPVTLSGKLEPGVFSLSGNVSSQFISGLLFALPLLDGPTEIVIENKIESLPYIQMTIQVLEEFGIRLHHNGDYRKFEIPGNQTYRAIPYYAVEGDWSQAAFLCVMGAMSGSVTIEGVSTASAQGDKVILDILRKMGAEPVINENEITFHKARLKGIEVDVSQCPDLVPAIAAAASVADGRTNIINAARLRIKESDRLTTTCRELSALGALIEETPDSLIIRGLPLLKGGKASGSGDHRIVMSLACASTLCTDAVEIEGSEAVRKSWPGFWEDFVAIGGRVEFL